MVKINESEQLALLKKIIAPAAMENILPVNLSRIEKIIKERIPQTLEKNAPPNFPELYFDFEYVYSKFYDFLLFNPLIGKTVVALGGGFSSGKSTFLNTLLGNAKILPTAIRPSTSVPAYVIKSENESAEGINTFGARVAMDFTDIRAIAHGFGENDNDDNEITLGHLLRSLFVSTPQMPYENIAFLDTPGYSKADSADYSAKTDEKIAHSQLNASDYILWFVAADAGTISVDDINFLASLDKDIPKLIIINKADKAPSAEILNDIKEKTKAALDLKGIRYENVLTYSRKETVACDREEVHMYLQGLNAGKTETDFARKFKKLFVTCKNYYDDALNEEQRNLSYINRALTFATDSVDLTQYLSVLLADTKTSIDSMSNLRKELNELKNAFFSEIKDIADHVGLYMPEPSEVDLVNNNGTDLLSIVESIVREKGITTSRDILHEIKNKLSVFQHECATNEQDFNFSVLRKEASQEPLYHHPLAESATKELYLTLLVSVLAVDGANANSWKHVYRIAAGGKYEGDAHELLPNALRINNKLLINIIEVINSTPLRDVFILDSLYILITNCSEYINRAMKFLSCVYSLLNVQTEIIAQGIELVKLYQSKNRELYTRDYHKFSGFDMWNICCYSPFCIENMTQDISFAKSCNVDEVLVYASSVKNVDEIDIEQWNANNITFMFSSFENIGVIKWNEKQVQFFNCELNRVSRITSGLAHDVIIKNCTVEDIRCLHILDGSIEECSFQWFEPLSSEYTVVIFDFVTSGYKDKERYVYVKSCVFRNFSGRTTDGDMTFIELNNHVSVENNHFISLSLKTIRCRYYSSRSSIFGLNAWDSSFEGVGIIKDNKVDNCSFDVFINSHGNVYSAWKNARGLPMFTISNNG